MNHIGNTKKKSIQSILSFFAHSIRMKRESEKKKEKKGQLLHSLLLPLSGYNDHDRCVHNRVIETES